jgi:hypothetical protein
LHAVNHAFNLCGGFPNAPFRLRDESAEAARVSRKLQQEYMRHRREAQEAHMQADAAMRHAYKLEREALKASTEAAERQHMM